MTDSRTSSFGSPPSQVQAGPETRRWGSWSSIVVGAVIALIGLILAAGGAWLAMLGGSLYYLVVGVAMAVAGALLIKGRLAGGWLYLGIVAVTFIWAWWESGPDAWALVPRIVAPVVLLVAVLLVMPTLSWRRNRWQPVSYTHLTLPTIYSV